jgi:hypothetical protein
VLQFLTVKKHAKPSIQWCVPNGTFLTPLSGFNHARSG